MSEQGYISVAYIDGRYEVMYFKSDDVQSFPVWRYSYDDAMEVANRWNARYGVGVNVQFSADKQRLEREGRLASIRRAIQEGA